MVDDIDESRHWRTHGQHQHDHVTGRTSVPSRDRVWTLERRACKEPGRPPVMKHARGFSFNKNPGRATFGHNVSNGSQIPRLTPWALRPWPLILGDGFGIASQYYNICQGHDAQRRQWSRGLDDSSRHYSSMPCSALPYHAVVIQRPAPGTGLAASPGCIDCNRIGTFNVTRRSICPAEQEPIPENRVLGRPLDTEIQRLYVAIGSS